MIVIGSDVKIDAHQHFWDYSANAADYVWMGDEHALLKRDFLPADLAPLLEATGFNATVAVQAREMEVETRFLLDLARSRPAILGVVGWADLCAPNAGDRIDSLAHPKLRGFRMLIHDRPDPDFAASPHHLRGVAMLESRGLTYDLLLKPPHLASAVRLVDALPNQSFVVDHIAKPALDGSDWDIWAAGMAAIAARSNVWCKLSGLATLGGWPPDGIERYLDHVVALFGAARCMIGSDWPVATCAASYQDTMAIVARWGNRLSVDERAFVMGATCADFYGLGNEA